MSCVYGANNSRRASVLLIIAGLSAILCALSLALLQNMRSDLEESNAMLRDVQARTMIAAGLSYIQEGARLGWDIPTTPEHEEGYGWIDARDGSIGPNDRFGNRLFVGDAATGQGAAFPAVGGSAARCPMYVMRRPPFSVAMTLHYNPIPRQPAADWRQNISYSNLEPQAAEGSGLSATDMATLAAGDRDLRYAAWAKGDPVARNSSVGLAWMRVYRMSPEDAAAHVTIDGKPAPLSWSPAMFIISGGAGASGGFRSWLEVELAGEEDLFSGGQAEFEDVRRAESILWFACEWSPAEGFETINHYLTGSFETPVCNRPCYVGTDNRTVSKSFGGSFRWIERLANEPKNW
jgi:hypothetical protein